MSLTLIQESAKEVRRLAIAGSLLAVDDFRLKKLVEPLEDAGAKVPVFAQVAKAINEVINGNEADSAVNLLNLSTLLNAILYTQGQSSVEGDFQELETFASNCTSTRTTARLLKPLIQALRTAGGGRFETVKSAVERGAFNDLRLIEHAIYALGDNYNELADLVAEKILPGYGPGIVPRLKAGLDLKGKKHDARKLLVMHQLDPNGTLQLCKAALEDGSVDIKAAAIACLGEHHECLPLVLEQANSKNKELRAAALEALAQHDRPEIKTLFSQLIKGKALDVLIGPFRSLRNRQVLNSLLDEGRNVFGLVLKSDEDSILRFSVILECLKDKKDAQVEEFLLECFSQSEKLSKIRTPKKSALIVQTSATDLADRMAWLLYEFGSTRALEAVVAKRDVLPAESFIHVLHSALRVWSPEKVYQEFSGLLEQEKGPGKLKRETLQHAIFAASFKQGVPPFGSFGRFDQEAAHGETLKKVEWDPRWLEAAIKAEQTGIVCCLAQPGHKGVITYLLKAAESKGQKESWQIVKGLAQAQYAKLTEVFLDLVAKRIKLARYLDYELQLLIESARYLPAGELQKLEAFAADIDQKFVDKFLEALQPLRDKKSDGSDVSRALHE